MIGCLMKNGIATYGSLAHDYVLKINGRANSIHRRYEDALREGLLLRYQFPRDDIKVCEITEEVMEGTLLHWLRFSDSLEADAISLKEVDCVQPN